MIADRTKRDVQNAKKVILEKVQFRQELTESDVEILERGTLTINTLNRIEQKQDELCSAFTEQGYFCKDVENKAWKNGDIFKLSDFERIISNLDVLRTAFFVLTLTPKNPLPKFHFSNTNDLEKILIDLEENLDYMISQYRQCGTFQCGE